MSGTTNQLVEWAKGAAGPDLHGAEFDDEYDVVVASGEQVTAGLLALALRKQGTEGALLARLAAPAQDRRSARQGPHHGLRESRIHPLGR